MNKKMMVLAISVVSAAAMALPAVASAGTWHLEPAQNGTVEGGNTELKSSGVTITCTSVSGTSAFDSGSTTTGILNLTFHGCKNKAGLHCQTKGDATGTITAPNLPFHLVILHTGPPKIVGILITPTAAGPFASFECAGIPVVVAGNGVLGELSSPSCGANTNAVTFTFGLNAGGTAQAYTQVTTSGTVYGLTSKVGMAAANPATQTGVATVTVANEPLVNCT
jgi:polyisoprenoid-binding protein YceI